jgi:CRP-like cAMP-binding protein
MPDEQRVRAPGIIPSGVRSLAREVAIARGQWVFKKGEAVHSVFFVVDGEVRLSRFSKGGDEIALHRAGSGEFFAEAALGGSRYHCNAIASRNSTLLVFPADAMRTLLAKDPDFAREWSLVLARQLHSARARLERIALKSAAERVVHYLQTEGGGSRFEVQLRGTVKDLAHELGLTHESLYRTLARLKRDRVVGQKDGTLFLLK